MFRFFYKNFIFFLLLPALSCGDGTPSGVMPDEKMKAVLWDVAMAGEYANGYLYFQNPSENKVLINDELMKEVFRVHGITKKEFDKSLEYYKQHPKTLMALLDSIAVKHGGPGAIRQTDPALGGALPSAAQPQLPTQQPTSPPPALDAGIVDTTSRTTPPVQ